jgi:hypothetical protein
VDSQCCSNIGIYHLSATGYDFGGLSAAMRSGTELTASVVIPAGCSDTICDSPNRSAL